MKNGTNDEVWFVEIIGNWPRVINRMAPDGLSFTVYRWPVSV